MIRAQIQKIGVDGIFTNYIDGFKRQIGAQAFPVLTIILRHIEIGSKIVPTIAAQTRINPSAFMRGSNHPAYPKPGR